jgi:hypothetical protein
VPDLSSQSLDPNAHNPMPKTQFLLRNFYPNFFCLSEPEVFTWAWNSNDARQASSQYFIFAGKDILTTYRKRKRSLKGKKTWDLLCHYNLSSTEKKDLQDLLIGTKLLNIQYGQIFLLVFLRILAFLF